MRKLADMSCAVTVEDLGFSEVTTSDVAAEQVSRLAAALDRSNELSVGDHVPLLWHWALFTPTLPNSELGDDGHPRRPLEAATAGFPRRMFAGGETRQIRPLILGRQATRHASILDVQQKSGRSGQLLVVTVAFEVQQNGNVAIVEEQTLIYREATSPLLDPSLKPQVVPRASGWREEITVDRVTLFRFSAATFNAHRIHYDEVYARQKEDYPGLVVQGPLTALLLAESAAEHLGRDLQKFSFRATAPLFEGQRFYLLGEWDGLGALLKAVRGDGAVAMSASTT